MGFSDNRVPQSIPSLTNIFQMKFAVNWFIWVLVSLLLLLLLININYSILYVNGLCPLWLDVVPLGYGRLDVKVPEPQQSAARHSFSTERERWASWANAEVDGLHGSQLTLNYRLLCFHTPHVQRSQTTSTNVGRGIGHRSLNSWNTGKDVLTVP